MTSSGGLPAGPRRDGLLRALDGIRTHARWAAGDVLSHVPDTGDMTTGRAVDDFVEQAADSLRALDEIVTASMRRLDSAGEMPGDGMPGSAAWWGPQRPGRDAYRPGLGGEP